MAENELAGPMAVGTGDSNSKAVTVQNYHPIQKIATPADLAATIIAVRFGLSPRIARVVCELARIGGRLA